MTRITRDANTFRTSALLLAVIPATSAHAAELYDRAAWVADIPPGAHQVEGIATIVNERTIHVEHFTYDGTAPAVYFYLGETDDDDAFEAGIPIGPELDRAYDDESITLVLPEDQSLNGYGAISVWCEEFGVNFSSASFEAPAAMYPRAGWTALLLPGAHDAQGEATIITDRIISVEHFTYDGTAPAVYFYLGETDDDDAFDEGIPIGPMLDRPYDDEAIAVALPDDQSLDGYAAISVWCEEFSVSFTSALFLSSCPADVTGDQVVDVLDLLAVLAAWGDTGQGLPEDISGDGVVDVVDVLQVLSAWGSCW